jgi:hypothetical protein
VVDVANELLFLNLSAATGGAEIADAQGFCAVVDDDTAAISVNDVSVAEGNGGARNATFAVSLSTPADHPISVHLATADGTARSPGDYQPVSGTVTFAPGQVLKAFNVAVNGDVIDESNEGFVVNLSGATGGATIHDSQGLGIILDDDTVGIRVNDVTVTEGNNGMVAATFTVFLSTQADHAVSVKYATANGAAVSPVDYLGATGTLGFAPGQTSKTVTVLVRGDLLDELNERFFLNLSAAGGGATIADAQGAATIIDDD